mgnify:CR=1 FL=1
MVILQHSQRTILSEGFQQRLYSVRMLMTFVLGNSFRYVCKVIVNKANAILSWNVPMFNCITVKDLQKLVKIN